MSMFAVAKPVTNQSAMVYAKALLMIVLRFGLTHTIVLYAEKKFYNAFRQMCELLRLNVHTISGEIHDPMLVERVNSCFNKGSKIFTQEQETPAISREAVLLLIYAWNRCSVPLTVVSCAMVVTGRDFSFPIGFFLEKAVQLTGTKNWAETYDTSQGRLLLHTREIVVLCIEESRSYQRKRLNELRPDPCRYAIGNLVLAHRSVKSNRAKNVVDKTEFAYTGP